MRPVDPPRWTTEEFDEQRERARQIFCNERLSESQGVYAETFDECVEYVNELLENTEELSTLETAAGGALTDPSLFEVLTDPDLMEALRYIVGPPVSTDDLAELADTSLAPQGLRENTEAASRVVSVVAQALDPRRFRWVREGRAPTDEERVVATTATAVLMATRRVETARRMQFKGQEAAVKTCLLAAGLIEVGARPVTPGLFEAPQPGEFCGEALFGKRKADLIVRLHDARCLPIECKMSNSSTNSVKRLNNDAAAKASAWIEEFGSGATIPCAVLSGIFKTRNLEQAQDQHLTIFWAHNLDPLAEFVRATE